MPRRSPEADDVLITTPRGQKMLEEQRRREAEKAKADAAKRARADRMLGVPTSTPAKVLSSSGTGYGTTRN
jgi:hypothetical protein